MKGWNLDHSYAQLPDTFFTKQKPEPVADPKLVILNEPLALELGLDAKELKSPEATAIFAGNELPKGSEPLAQAYAGHQFGHLNLLGDGRAILLGEQVTSTGTRRDIQLKGPGPTRYSRGGDGRAALGPMLREYIISEAMHALGIPTTRSLAVVTTGELIYREEELPGAILTRVASSHIRVGTFEYAARIKSGEHLQTFVDYVINRHDPELNGVEDKYLLFLKNVIRRQAALIAKWQLVGFIHGVMNTDNMTISGETIDYGPCAFMDTYDPATVFSSIDREGRYAYGNQPYIGSWNLSRFAETLLPLLAEEEEDAVAIAQEALLVFTQEFQHHYFNGMRAKLGLFEQQEDDEQLINDLLALMHANKADYTNTFSGLTKDIVEPVLAANSEFIEWKERYQTRLESQTQTQEQVKQLMRQNNPIVIPRNHRVEEALEAAVARNDYTVLEKLLKVLARPFDYEIEAEMAEYCRAPVPTGTPYRTYCGT